MDTSALNLTRTWFDEHLRVTRERVHRTGHREWFAKSLVIPPVPLIAAFAAYQGFGWYCAQPDGAAQLGLGIAREWQWSRSEGLLRMERHARALLAEGLPNTTQIIGGVAFSPDVLWPDWPAVYAAIPLVRVFTTDTETTLTVTLAIDPDEPWESYLEKLNPIWNALVAKDYPNASGQPPIRVVSRPSRESWMQEVARATNHIKSGDFIKVVLARALELRFAQPVNVPVVIDNLRVQNPEATVFALRRATAVFLGATPELLARVTDRTVESMSLAGSAPRGLNPQDDSRYADEMKGDAKNQREHAVVRQHVRDRLSHLTRSLDMPEPPDLKRLPTVQHLLTPVRAELNPDASIWAVVQQLHPTPAVAGYPVETATRYIVEQAEPFRRGWYAGSVGWSTLSGDGQWMVALRSALIHDRDVYLYAGCGIMRESDPAAELSESDWKFGTMLSALELEGDPY